MAVAATIAVASRTAEYPTASIADLLRWCASITPSRLQDELKNRSVQFGVYLDGVAVSLDPESGRWMCGSFLSKDESCAGATRFTGFCEVPAERALSLVTGGQSADVDRLVEIWRVEPDVGPQVPEPIVVETLSYPNEASRIRDRISRRRRVGPEGAQEAGNVGEPPLPVAEPVTTSWVQYRVTAADVLVRREVATAVVQALIGSAPSDIKAWRDGALQLELLRRMQSPGEDGYAPGLHAAWVLWQRHVLGKTREEREDLKKKTMLKEVRRLVDQMRAGSAGPSAWAWTDVLCEAVAAVIADQYMYKVGPKRQTGRPTPAAPAARTQVRLKKRPKCQ